MEEGKIKNTITRSFELQDYKIEGAELSGFWADLTSKEELIVEVNYSPENKKTFSPEETRNSCPKNPQKCDSFEAQLPENIKCEVTFKNFGEKITKAASLILNWNPGNWKNLRLLTVFTLNITFNLIKSQSEKCCYLL